MIRDALEWISCKVASWFFIKRYRIGRERCPRRPSGGGKSPGISRNRPREIFGSRGEQAGVGGQKEELMRWRTERAERSEEERERREKKGRGQNDTVRVLLIVLLKVVVVRRNGVNCVFTERRACSGGRSRTSDASDEGSGFH